MIGTIINVCTIITGSVIGSVVRKGIKEEYSGALFTAMGLAAVALGINAIVGNMPNSDYPVLFIISLAAGSLIGTILDIDGRFQRLTGKFGSSQLSQGLSTAVLLFCIGTLSILGPIQSALYADHTFLFTTQRWTLLRPWYWPQLMVLVSHYQQSYCFCGKAVFMCVPDF